MTCLMAAVVLAVLVGRGPTSTRWGGDGVRSMYAIAAICLGAAVFGALPLMVTARRRPDYIGQAALGGMVLRLLFTMGGGVAYQVLAKPLLPAFLTWAVVFYLLLLTIETVFAVMLVRRHYRPPSCAGGMTA